MEESNLLIAEEHGIAYDVCGKIVVVTHEDELSRLDSIREMV